MNKESCRYICKESFCLLNFILICYGHPDCPGALNCSFGNATVALVLPSVRALSAVQIFLVVIKVLFAVGIITCVLSHYKMGARSWSDQRNRQQPTTRQPQQQQYTYSLTPTTASMMYTPMQERQRLETAAHHDHLVRLHSVQTDLALNLPHTVALPEEGLPLKQLHDPAEITRSFIRPPPNRTVCNGRSNSVGLAQKPTLLPPRSHSVSGHRGPSRTFDSKYGSVDPPPPYSDVVNQWDVNTVSRQQNSGI